MSVFSASAFRIVGNFLLLNYSKNHILLMNNTIDFDSELDTLSKDA